MFHLFETIKPKLKEIKLDSSKRLEDFELPEFSKKLVKNEDGNIRYQQKEGIIDDILDNMDRWKVQNHNNI